MDACQHLTEGQFFTLTNAPAFLLAEACRRKVRRAELVEIFECFGFFWMHWILLDVGEGEDLRSINLNL